MVIREKARVAGTEFRWFGVGMLSALVLPCRAPQSILARCLPKHAKIQPKADFQGLISGALDTPIPLPYRIGSGALRLRQAWGGVAQPARAEES